LEGLKEKRRERGKRELTKARATSGGAAAASEGRSLRERSRGFVARPGDVNVRRRRRRRRLYCRRRWPPRLRVRDTTTRDGGGGGGGWRLSPPPAVACAWAFTTMALKLF